MLHLFKKSKVTINSITFPTFDWEITKEDNYFKQWINKEQSIALSINYFDSKPDLPYLNDIDVLREFYRKELSEHNGGLIQVDLTEIAHYLTIKTVFKISQEPAGISYLTSLTFPFQRHSFVIKIQAVEPGMTGQRESVILNKLTREKIIPSSQEGWAQDPYQKNFTKGLLMNQSEQSSYDPRFPSHALSQARKLILDIENNIHFDSELANLKRLRK